MAIEYEREYREREAHNGNAERLANSLGWFSVGLGLAEVIAPEVVSYLIGIADRPGRRSLLRSYGIREIAAGIGILSQPRPAGWLWGRVAGDALDLASLGSAMTDDDADRRKVALATAAVLGVTALDVYCGQQLSRRPESALAVTSGKRVRLAKSIIVSRPPEEAYAFWRKLENLPNFMDHLESVQTIDEKRSHWRAKTPGGITVEWDSEIIREEPNSLIGWRSMPGSDLESAGSVRFERAPGGRGTIVRVKLEYAPPGGAVGANIARLFGAEPGQEIEKALRLMKQILETGGIVKSDASIHAGMHPARPPEDERRDRQPSARRRGTVRSRFMPTEFEGRRI
jgi:uncharacterized membrane protein